MVKGDKKIWEQQKQSYGSSFLTHEVCLRMLIQVQLFHSKKRLVGRNNIL